MTALVSAQNPADLPAAPDAFRPKLETIDSLWGRGIKVPVEKLCDLARLDPDEIRAGYADGSADAPEPGNNRSRACWHGWRCGQMESFRMEQDTAARELARRVFWWMTRASRSRKRKSTEPRYDDLERAYGRGEPV